jgi:hypothetical protein
MKRKMYLTIVILSAIAIIATVNVNLVKVGSFSSSLTIENFEALSDESSESGGFDCQVKTANCKFKAKTSLHVTILRNRGYSVGGIDAEVDISDGTQIYYKESWYWFWEDRVRCGVDVTCNTYQRQLGLIS